MACSGRDGCSVLKLGAKLALAGAGAKATRLIFGSGTATEAGKKENFARYFGHCAPAPWWMLWPMRRHHGPVDPALETRRLYIEHLAERLEQMELGNAPMKAIAYRLFARRLREAMAGFPEAHLVAKLSRQRGAVTDALAMRFFDTHGRLPAPEGEAVRSAADLLLGRVRRPA